MEQNMGCDIHSHAEKNDNGQWVHMEVAAFDRRHCYHNLFGWLAGVPNHFGLTPLAALRGLPADASIQTTEDHNSWLGDAHSESWVGMNELLAVDYDQPTRWVSLDELLAANEAHATDDQPHLHQHGTLREFLGPNYFAAIQRLQDAGADRVVFWFDN